MKFTRYAAAAVIGLGTALVVLPGCQTNSESEPGMKSLVGSYSEIIKGNPDSVTTAARKSLEQMKLTDVAATGTKTAGKVTGKTAQNEDVNVDIEQAGDGLSKVTVRVGAAGDETTSRAILEKTKSNMHWF